MISAYPINSVALLNRQEQEQMGESCKDAVPGPPPCKKRAVGATEPTALCLSHSIMLIVDLKD
jgi:hypothetical protein